jgi:hypothetical protein
MSLLPLIGHRPERLQETFQSSFVPLIRRQIRRTTCLKNPTFDLCGTIIPVESRVTFDQMKRIDTFRTVTGVAERCSMLRPVAMIEIPSNVGYHLGLSLDSHYRSSIGIRRTIPEQAPPEAFTLLRNGPII